MLLVIIPIVSMALSLYGESVTCLVYSAKEILLFASQNLENDCRIFDTQLKRH